MFNTGLREPHSILQLERAFVAYKLFHWMHLRKLYQENRHGGIPRNAQLRSLDLANTPTILKHDFKIA